MFCDLHNAEFVLPLEMNDIIRVCVLEICSRMWFVRNESIKQLVARLCFQVYEEYKTLLVEECLHLDIQLRKYHRLQGVSNDRHSNHHSGDPGVPVGHNVHTL